MSAPLARAIGVSRRYGQVVALADVDLDVPAGQVLGLLGPNGAGKSTLVNLLAGLRRPSSGRVELFGGDPAEASRRTRLGLTPQDSGLPDNLTVHEALELVRRHYPDPEPAAGLLERFGLAGLQRRQTGGLSGGQRRRLSLALAFAGRPLLVLLDEPTTGLDVEARNLVWTQLREYRDAGGTVLLTSHNMSEVEALADIVVVVDRGRVLARGGLDDIRSQVPLRRVRLTCAGVPPVTHERASRDGDRHELWTTDSDRLVRELVATGFAFRDLEVATASLEEAFLDITRRSDDPASATGRAS